jgi:hypothetical protein
MSRVLIGDCPLTIEQFVCLVLVDYLVRSYPVSCDLMVSTNEATGAFGKQLSFLYYFSAYTRFLLGYLKYLNSS